MTKKQITNTQIALVSVLATGALILSACSSSDTATTQSQPTTSATPESVPGTVSVVATTTILGDVANNIVACAGGTVEVLMPIGADAHDFSASSDQVASMINADLVISNGLDLESGLIDSLENAAIDGANVFEIAPLINPIEFGAGMHDEEGDAHSDEEGDAHDHGDLDPHFWFDMNRMADAAQLIGAELTQITGDEVYITCADTTATQIQSAESDVREILESVQVEKRILVTDHDALGYLAAVYGYEVAGAVIPAGTTAASPSSSDLAELVETIKAEDVKAIFANTAVPADLADAVAAETGDDVSVVTLYVGSLGGPDSPAATYIDMMRSNASLIAQALQD
jgi:zinc/manganese transport system substrate-binding protein